MKWYIQQKKARQAGAELGQTWIKIEPELSFQLTFELDISFELIIKVNTATHQPTTNFSKGSMRHKRLRFDM